MYNLSVFLFYEIFVHRAIFIILVNVTLVIFVKFDSLRFNMQDVINYMFTYVIPVVKFYVFLLNNVYRCTHKD